MSLRHRLVPCLVAVAGFAAVSSASTVITFANLVPAGSASPPSGYANAERRSTYTVPSGQAAGLVVTAYADPRGFSYQTYNGVRGLGVANPSPTAPQREINGSEFILLTFSMPVAISRLDIAQIYRENGINETAQFVVNPTLGGNGVQFVAAGDGNDADNLPDGGFWTNGIGSSLGGTISEISATGNLSSTLSNFAAGTTANFTTRAFSGGVNANNSGLSNDPNSYNPGANNPGGARSLNSLAANGNIFHSGVTSLLMRVKPGQGSDVGTIDGADFSFVQLGVTVIPLPPAAWAGLTMLGTVAGIGIIRRRQQRA